MNTISKKFAISGGWVVTSIALFLLVHGLRQVGTTWMNEPGFLRVLILLALALSAFVPLLFAILVWFDQPKRFYRKLK